MRESVCEREEEGEGEEEREREREGEREGAYIPYSIASASICLGFGVHDSWQLGWWLGE